MTTKDVFSDLVDEDDNVIGCVPRTECHGNPDLIHRTAHVHVFNRQGELLLQKRSQDKQVQPGKWDTSVGGHLEAGETYLAGALREMHEELGIAHQPLTFLYHYRLRNDFESENVATYKTEFDGRIDFAIDEIESVRFWSAQEIEAALETGVLTPNFEEEWQLLKEWGRRCTTRTDAPVAFCSGDSFPDLKPELQAGK